MKLNRILSVPILILVFTLFVKAEYKQTFQGQNIEKLMDNVTFGVIIGGNNPEKEFKEIKELGFSHCQLNVAEYTPGLARRIRSSVKKNKVFPTTLICMGPGKYAWNFTEGPSTIGLIPCEFRAERIKRLHEGIEVPVPQGDVNFPEIVRYLKQIHFKGNITIEHELAEKNYEYFVKTKKYLENLFSTLN